MIFRQWQQVLDNTKTQTRRLVKEGEQAVIAAWGAQHNFAVIAAAGRLKWMVGRAYAVQPGRGQPAIWIGPDGTPYDTPLAEYLRRVSGIDAPRWGWGKRVKAWLQEHGYREARFHITGIRRERVQDITYEDARAEGCRVSARHCIWGITPRKRFSRLWDSIHKKRGARWADNPEVWVLEFKVVAQEAGR